jgi:hypothetical protein
MVSSPPSVSAFLERHSFAGDDSRVSAPSFVGTARFNGVIAFSNRSRSDVARCLPPGLELAANRSSAPDVHPLVFLFGEQTEGGTVFAGLTLPLGLRYHELALAVPFVKHSSGTRLHTWIARMYSSYFPATWNGNAYYGFAKEMAQMEQHGGLFVATGDDGKLLVHASVESTATWSNDPASEIPHFDAMREVFALPIVGRKASGDLVCSYFGFDFDDARVRACDASVFVDRPIVGGLATGDYPDVASGSIEVSGMAWRLSWPTSCRF